MKTIKIIDLLNMIANGENVPKKIKANGIVFIFDKDDNEYKREDGDADEFYTDYMINGFVNLTDEVEIIEDKEDKKIEEIKINFDEFYKHYIITTTINGKKYDSITNSATDKILCGKINEIIKYMNKEEK